MADIEICALQEPDAGARNAALRRGPASKAKVYEDWVEMLDREKPDITAIGNAADERAQAVLEAIPEPQRLRLPMRPHNRSLNLSNAVAVMVFEAWRQAGFAGGD